MPLSVTSQAVSVIREESASEFEAIFHIYRPKVFRLMLASLRDVGLAENLTQDCFFQAYKAYANFRNDCKLSTWLMQIAVNLLRDHAKNRRLQFWRRLTRASEPLDLDSLGATKQACLETQLAVRQQVLKIWEAADRLPEKQKLVFLLRFLEEMEVAEIVFATGLTESTVRTHLVRAVASVREMVEEAV